MRTLSFLLLIALTCFASATFRDLRKNVKISPELSQDAVARQQALQKQQGQVGGVPQKTDDGGYSPAASSDSDAAAVVANHGQGTDSAASDVLQKNEELMKGDAERPKKAASGALWALFAGLLLAFGAWAGMQKYGPKPPEHVRPS